MNIRNHHLAPALLSMALSAGLLTTQAQAQRDLSPQITDDDWFSYVAAEADYTDAEDGQLRWDVEGWIGSDYRKLWLLSDGEYHDGELEDAQLQLLYGHYLAPFWDWRAGIRHDFEPDSLNHAVLGIKGMAPYRFETDASLYLSEEGDLSAELEVEYALLFTQRLIAEPYIDLELFAQDVPERGKGSGLSEITAGLRVRYEIRREFAPYLDLSYTRLTGETADLARDAGEDVEDTVLRVGLRVWF